MPDYSTCRRTFLRNRVVGADPGSYGEARHDECPDENRHERNRKTDRIPLPLYR